jgi:hypothetical protein
MAGGAVDLENRMPKATEQTHSNPAPTNPGRARGVALDRFFTRPGVDPMTESVYGWEEAGTWGI